MKIEVLRDSKILIYAGVAMLAILALSFVGFVIDGPDNLDFLGVVIVIGLSIVTIRIANKNEDADKILARAKANSADVNNVLFGKKTSDSLMFLQNGDVRLLHSTEAKAILATFSPDEVDLVEVICAPSDLNCRLTRRDNLNRLIAGTMVGGPAGLVATAVINGLFSEYEENKRVHLKLNLIFRMKNKKKITFCASQEFCDRAVECDNKTKSFIEHANQCINTLANVFEGKIS